MAEVRLQKILAECGVASRRTAEAYILAGRVRVNGRIVTELGSKADLAVDRVEFDGKRLVRESSVYVIFHKPRGVVSTLSDPEGRSSVKEFISKIPGRVFPIGRLDFATSGALLITNDGDFSDGLLHPKRAVPKTYVVKLAGLMQDEDLALWRTGIELEDGKTLPAEVDLLRYEEGKTWIQLTIREGRNQQIRRMGEATHFPVMRLARMKFAEIDIEGLKPGSWRHLTRDELMMLRKNFGVPKHLKISGSAEPISASRTLRTIPNKAGSRPDRPRTPRISSRDGGDMEGRSSRPSRGNSGASVSGNSERSSRSSRGSNSMQAGASEGRSSRSSRGKEAFSPSSKSRSSSFKR